MLAANTRRDSKQSKRRTHGQQGISRCAARGQKERMKPRLVFEPGTRFGRLTIESGPHRHDGCIAHKCRCDCGVVVMVRNSSLKHGNNRSCGCLERDMRVGRLTTHNRSRTKEYRTWISVRNRCEKPTTSGYHRYGGRGIRVCSGWRSDFGAFLKDVGPCPSREHSIDRIDNDGHYSCGHCAECIKNGWTANCRWATPEEQARTRSTTVWLEFKGERLRADDWAKRINVSRETIYLRLKAGLPMEQVLYAGTLKWGTKRPGGRAS